MPVSRLARHECGWHICFPLDSALDDPVEVFGDNLLVGSQINELLLSFEKVYDLRLCHRLGRGQVEDSVCKYLYGAAEDVVAVCGGIFVGKVDDAHCLRAALGHIFILELLGEREVVDFVEVAATLERVKLRIGRRDDAKASARDVAKADVERVHAGPVDEVDAVRDRSAKGVVRVHAHVGSRRKPRP